MLLLCDRWQQRGSLTQWHLAWKCGWSKGVSLDFSTWKKVTHWYSSALAECLWRLNSECEAQWDSGWCISAVVTAAWNTVCVLDQLIHVNQWIVTRKLCTELNISFSVLEMVAMLEYHKVCTRWIPWVFTQNRKNTACSFVRTCQTDMRLQWVSGLHHYWSMRYWYHDSKPESELQSMERWHMNFQLKGKV